MSEFKLYWGVYVLNSNFFKYAQIIVFAGTIFCGAMYSEKTSADAKIFHKKSGYLFDPNDTSCDGFPMLQVQTMKGTCLGMVLSRESAKDTEADRDFIKPRTIVQLKNSNSFLVADMGGWKPRNGRLFLLKRRMKSENYPRSNDYLKNPYEVKILKFGMDTPHGLAAGPNGFYYIGEKDRISRFKVIDNKVAAWETIVRGLPSYEGHMHPLTQFVFDPQSQDLYINSGAPSDHCFLEGTGDYKSCPESEKDGMGAIYKIPHEALSSLPISHLKKEWLVARGLRNSMAMAIHPSGFLIQGENGRDFPEFEEPYEEINVINLAKTRDDNGKVKHYGWPYCYNYRATSPEWDFEGPNNYASIKKRFKKPAECNENLWHRDGIYQEPHALMPPHVAPLHADYYSEANAKSSKGLNLKNKIIFSWHGHQPTGNRLVAYSHDSQGLPIVETHSKATFKVDEEGGCPRVNTFSPHGGMLRNAPYEEIISGWNKIEGVRPEGAPVGFTIAEDGSIWIVEDRSNRSILRLAKYDGVGHSDNCSQSEEEYNDPKVKLLIWRDYLMSDQGQMKRFNQISNELINVSCLGCHGNFKVDDIDESELSTLDFLIKSEMIVPQNKNESRFYGAIAQTESFTPMPPASSGPLRGTVKGDELISLVGDWISRMPKKINQRSKKIRIVSRSKRNVRNVPNLSSSTVCGIVQNGDVLYTDARKSEIVKKDGYIWVKLYLVPGHTRLNKDACESPDNGVYYLAIGREGSDSEIIEPVNNITSL